MYPCSRELIFLSGSILSSRLAMNTTSSLSFFMSRLVVISSSMRPTHVSSKPIPPPWHIFLQTVSTGFWVYSPNLLTTVHAREYLFYRFQMLYSFSLNIIYVFSLHGFAFPVTGGRLYSGVLPHCQTPLQLQNITAFPIQDPSHTWIGQVPYNVRYLNVSDDNVFTVLRIEDDPTVTHDD